ncbi:MAG: menaquinone biosynthesis protein [Bacteroidales bacterium]|nr:menaquinone biosynthesis protein [Bacteroidales bacterium]
METMKIHISALSYSNTFPFVYGLEKKLRSRVEKINFEVPAVSASRFGEGEVEVALVPVGALIHFKINYQIITDYCIGADGPVKTVCLYSNVSIPDLKTIYLDTESMTSVALVKILAKFYWNISPVFLPLKPDYMPSNEEAILLIGDKTFGRSADFSFTYDLAEEWKNFTGLPFVFAVWVSKPNLSTDFINSLNDSLTYGLTHLAEVQKHFKLPVSADEYLNYLTNYLDFKLDFPKRKAVELFQQFQRKLSE